MPVRFDVKDKIALITMDSPPVNAVSTEFMEEIIAAFDRLNDMQDVQVAILTGAGKCFSAGADLKKRLDTLAEPVEGHMWARLRLARELGYCIMENKKPVIAAINGPAMGAGWALALCCDILVASEAAFISLPEINVGLMGGIRHSMRILGHSLVRRMMLTGCRVPAAELYRRGAVEACLPAEQLLPYCMELAGEIAAKSPIAVRLAKQGMATVEFMSIREGYRYEQNMTAELAQTEDSTEAMRAFVEKRPPIWKGR